ncbi:MAG: hypothetical protein JST92_14045, partial [Deltaproteobacteria bacterium]|nr:hypothetical protein [Deltaproteobacteria bacterium]
MTNIFWGAHWSTAAGQAERAQVDSFAQRYLPAHDRTWVLEQYVSQAGVASGAGEFAGEVVVADQPGAALTTDGVMQAVNGWLGEQLLPPATSNSLFVVYLPPGSTATGGPAFCSAACGLHLSSASASAGWGPLRVMVIPYPDQTCGSCAGSNDVVGDSLTYWTSSILASTVTNPEGKGWEDTSTGVLRELGDVCTDRKTQFAGFTIAPTWDQVNKTCPHGDVGGPSGDVTSPACAVALIPGSSVTIPVEIERHGDTGVRMDLMIAGLPAGVSGVFSTTSTRGWAESMLTLTAATSAPAGSAQAFVTATGPNDRILFAHWRMALQVTVAPADTSSALALSGPVGGLLVAPGPVDIPLWLSVDGGQVVSFDWTGLADGMTAALTTSTSSASGAATLRLLTGTSTPETEGPLAPPARAADARASCRDPFA